jgi:hypothetical protein
MELSFTLLTKRYVRNTFHENIEQKLTDKLGTYSQLLDSRSCQGAGNARERRPFQ